MTITNPQQYPMTVTVIIDGNRHNPEHLRITKQTTPPIPTPLRTSLDMPISLRKCQRIIQHIKDQYNVQAEHLQIHLLDKDWEDTFGGWDEDGNPNKRSYAEYKLGAENYKTAEYKASTNTLTIYQGGAPIYENANGVITNDPEALADSIM